MDPAQQTPGQFVSTRRTADRAAHPSARAATGGGRRAAVPRVGDSPFDSFSSPRASRGLLLWCVDAGLFAAAVVLPFIMGGRQAVGEYALVLIACWTMLAWCLHHSTRRSGRWRFSGMELLLGAGIAVCVLQTVTLSSSLLNTLSPRIARLLPMWQAAGNGASVSLLPGPWRTLSLAPAETLSSLCCLLAVAMLFVVAVQRLDTLHDARVLMRLITFSATVMAAFGCVQFLCGNGRFYWFYEHPFTHTRDYAKGAFTNPNHFADFLAMSVPILLAWYAVQSIRRHGQRRNPYPSFVERIAQQSGTIALICLGVVSIGILLSQSRGGLVTACIGAVTTLGLLMRQRLLTMKAAATIGGLALSALVSLTFFGDRIQSLIEHNFHELVSGDAEQLDHGDARQKIWAAAIDGISDYPLLGAGLSSHREVYCTYFDHPEIDGEYSHAENGYLQLALETGLIGLGIAAAAALLCGCWCVRGLVRPSSPEAGALLAAIVGAFAVNLVHSITDFVWYVPSIMTVMALIGGLRLPAEPTDGVTTSPPGATHPSFGARTFAFAGAVGVLALSVWMLKIKQPALAAEPHWFDYIRMVKHEQQLQDEFDKDEYERHKLTALQAAAIADPSNGRVQVRAATAALAIFRREHESGPNSMSLAHIRDAAMASQWESPQQLQEWLNAPGVIGDRTRLDEAWDHAQHALSLCPLLAEGYVRLGELAWLRGATRRQEDALLIQALMVRPYDPLVHFYAGREAWLRGKETAALEHWRRAFARNPEFRQLIIDLLASAVPAQFFLDNFELDADALSRLRQAYRNSQDAEGFQTVTRLLAEHVAADAAAAPPQEAVRLWRTAHEAYAELGDATAARRTAELAVQADPNAFTARLVLGQWLYRTQEYAAAREHLEFCTHRRPHDATLRQMLQTAILRARGPAPQVATGVRNGERGT